NKKENLKGPLSFGFEEFIGVEFDKVLPSREQIISAAKLYEISENSPMDNYLKKRFQTVDNKFAWQPKTGRLFIFNLSSDANKVLGLQIKTFNKSFPYLSYGLLNIYEKILNITLPPDLLEQAKKIDQISKIFNILHVD